MSDFANNVSQITGIVGMFDSFALNVSSGLTKSVGNYSNNSKSINNAIFGDPTTSHLQSRLGIKSNLSNALNEILNTTNNLNYNFNSSNDVLNFYNTINNLYKNTGYSDKDLQLTGVKNFIFDPASSIINLARGTTAKQNNENINNAINSNKGTALNNMNIGISNMNKLKNLNYLRNSYDMGGALDYGLLNLYVLNNYIDVLNKSKITSMPNSFLKPLFDSMNYFAMGGMTDFNEVNAGGTHELNQFGGIKVRPDALVEEGETITGTDNGDYVFSDRLKLSKEECKLLGVPIDSTYAEASKILRKEYDEMPNDEIARKGWEQVRDILILSLEMLKQEIALKEDRKQGLNSPKMLGVNYQVMQDMYYNEDPQEEVLLQQGRNPNIKSYGKGGSMYDIFQIGALIPSLISGMKNPDYSYANEVLNSIGKDLRLSIPNNYTYHTYNPVDELLYLNRLQALDAAVINTLLNTSDPSRNSSILAATALQAANRSKLISDIADINHARKVENTKLNNAITDQINNNLYKQAQFNASLDNLDYNRMVLGLKMKQEADAIRGANLSAGLTGLSNWADARRLEENSLGIAALSAIAQGTPFTDGMINALYSINPKLGNIGFSTREDYSAYTNMLLRQAILDALKAGNYNKNVYGSLDNYIGDLAVQDYIRSKRKEDPNWDGSNWGLSIENLNKIIETLNGGN